MQFLHLMIRVKDIKKTLDFFSVLGLKEVRRFDVSSGRFTLVYLRDNYNNCEIELTHNWDQEEDYSVGNSFGHIAFSVNDIYETCQKFKELGATIALPPRDGNMAFIKSPDGVSIELLQKGGGLPSNPYWEQEPTIGTW